MIDCTDYAALLAALEQLPVNAAWQARMADLLLESTHDYSGDPARTPTLPVVWQL